MGVNAVRAPQPEVHRQIVSTDPRAFEESSTSVAATAVAPAVGSASDTV